MDRFSARAESGPARGRRRVTLVRVALAAALVAGILWVLPVRRAGHDGGHHAAHTPTAPGPPGAAGGPDRALDPFERAGITELKEGQRGPGLRLATLDGRTASLEDWRDKAIVLNFWATWCQPCTLEMPTLEALWRDYRDRGLVVVGVSVDRGAPRAVLDPYLKNLALTFPILLDPDAATATAWRVTGIPATFLIRPGGEVAGMAMGAREWNSREMRALLDSMLAGSHAHRGTMAASAGRPSALVENPLEIPPVMRP